MESFSEQRSEHQPQLIVGHGMRRPWLRRRRSLSRLRPSSNPARFPNAKIASTISRSRRARGSVVFFGIYDATLVTYCCDVGRMSSVDFRQSTNPVLSREGNQSLVTRQSGYIRLPRNPATVLNDTAKQPALHNHRKREPAPGVIKSERSHDALPGPPPGCVLRDAPVIPAETCAEAQRGELALVRSGDRLGDRDGNGRIGCWPSAAAPGILQRNPSPARSL